MRYLGYQVLYLVVAVIAVAEAGWWGGSEGWTGRTP
jgi:hypothetical protein